jgi:hypothetical protein
MGVSVVQDMASDNETLGSVRPRAYKDFFNGIFVDTLQEEDHKASSSIHTT